jgi:hypothetical protein
MLELVNHMNAHKVGAEEVDQPTEMMGLKDTSKSDMSNRDLLSSGTLKTLNLNLTLTLNHPYDSYG